MNVNYLLSVKQTFCFLKSKICIISLFLFLFCHSSFGQSFRSDADILTFHSLRGKIKNNSEIDDVAYSKHVKGSFFLDSVWNKTDIYFQNDNMVMKGLDTRIDLGNNMLEVKCKDGIKVLPTFSIKCVVYPKSHSVFVTEQFIKSEIKGFYKIIVDSDNSLLCRYETKLRSSNYNIQMDVGSKKPQIVKKKYYYLYADNKIAQLQKTRKKLKRQFKHNTFVYNYINETKMNPRNENSLIQFIDYLNKKHIHL
ncbi:hypothetical protein EV201_1613 [Ancylomarina subtilis]|uniref:Uncharacterized protein n=1 Tax=Ancylomarina subtilis TaxID=1639035 RepID=A0A4Q7VLH0_9BACT|nr:hypothetical protein [Ancylomarina subtilis]RZT96957.1 hypothetical protein EV201_1613 [Ancylomarina subtilis]